MDGWQRVATAISQARPGLPFEKVASELDVSVATLRKMRDGSQSRFRQDVISKIAARLGWSMDTVRRLLEDPAYEPPVVARYRTDDGREIQITMESPDEPTLTIAADVGKLKNPAHHRAVAALVRQLLAEEEAEQ